MPGGGSPSLAPHFLFRSSARGPSSSAPASSASALRGGLPRPVARSPFTTRARPGAARAGRRPACWPPRSRPSPARSRCCRWRWKASACGPISRSELEAASGISVEYRDEGTMVVALNRDDAATLRHSYEFQKGVGPRSALADRGAGARARAASEAGHRRRRLEPARSSGRKPAARPCACGGGAHAPGSNWSNTARCARSSIESGRAAGVVTERGEDRADIVVLAAGAWSREIGGIPAAHRPPVRPIKGQMMALQMDPAAPLLRHVLWLPRAYLVPRLDGRLVIGATVEERGFDERLTAGGLLALLDGAWRAVPTHRGIAGGRDLGRVPSGLARRRADAGSERHRPARRRDRPSPQRHSADPGYAPRWSAPIS